MTKLSHGKVGISILSLVRNLEENYTELHFTGDEPWSGVVGQGKKPFSLLLPFQALWVFDRK